MCPSCGAKHLVDVRQCPSCRVSRIHRPETTPLRDAIAVGGATTHKRVEEVDVLLPCIIQEARFSIVVPGGGAASWTSGLIYATTLGLYFLSEKDGYDSEAKAVEAAKEPSETPKRLSPLSVFVPKGVVKRLVHGQFIGNFLEMPNLKIPIRLTNDGWKRLVGACRKLDITIET